MKTAGRVLLVLLFITPGFNVPPVDSASPADDILERLEESSREILDVKGTFSQTSYIRDLERTETYDGNFFIKKPFSMRWKYASPRDEEVIIRDTTTWIYKESERQALKTGFRKDAYTQVPIALLNSVGNLKKDFDVSLYKEESLELLPKNKGGYIERILLEVNPRGFPVKSFSIFDIHGNKIEIHVRNVKTNTGLEDSFFIFEVPEDVEVFDLNQ